MQEPVKPPDFERVHLERMLFAANVLLSETDHIGDGLEVELLLLKERVERSLLLMLQLPPED